MAVTANGMPTKEFFINMLTRDIALNDAILDLLDNCLDGVVRQKGVDGKKEDKNYYKGYSASITISKESFCIQDNCGGIPRDVAEKNAFRMGRTSTTGDGLPTVGIYGIGMKRAIFKLGKVARVRTKNAGKAYCVKIEKEWAEDADHWEFPIDELDEKDIPFEGTSVEVTELNSIIQNQWNTEEKLKYFVETLTTAIKTSYSLIIQKGFEIRINDKIIQANPVELLVSTGEKGIKPYIFEKTYGSVSVSLIVGFYAPTPSEEELDDGTEGRRRREDAGWTIVCNDRVVLYNDKTHLTGWGEAGVPSYHTQFIGIKGIVTFESTNPEELPMTTTKRGVDLSSSIYADVKNKMRDGLKTFTQYTNVWKGRISEERTHSKGAQSIPYTKILEADDAFRESYGIRAKKYAGAIVFKPELPKPKQDKPYVIIRYSKPREDVITLHEFFYKDNSLPLNPSEIGAKCFDILLEQSKEQKG